ncbi:hypothetical protein NDU88_002837 [Pleurodeles waltl]|uniref:Uncharacterized protein n=1 Tax=Pleurodeles waltl TaxID=8319 RepID=A0AAV7MPY0_PLEWA|nr:hypothetical protein NDU88_002837 [Pleurodeles waltl]
MLGPGTCPESEVRSATNFEGSPVATLGAAPAGPHVLCGASACCRPGSPGRHAATRCLRRALQTRRAA